MKVSIPLDMKSVLTVAEMPIVRELIKRMREDNDFDQYALSAARVASGDRDNFLIFDQKAQVAKNERVRDYYGDNSGNLDVWLEFIAFSLFGGCYLIGIYLSDVYQITGTASDSELKQFMFIKEYMPKE